MTSGAMRDLEKKTAPNGTKRQTSRQTDGHGDSMTKSAQWGRFSENIIGKLPVVKTWFRFEIKEKIRGKEKEKHNFFLIHLHRC